MKEERRGKIPLIAKQTVAGCVCLNHKHNQWGFWTEQENIWTKEAPSIKSLNSQILNEVTRMFIAHLWQVPVTSPLQVWFFLAKIFLFPLVTEPPFSSMYFFFIKLKMSHPMRDISLGLYDPAQESRNTGAVLL